MHRWKVLSLRYQVPPPFMFDEPQLQRPPHNHTSTSPEEPVGRRVKSEPGWLVVAQLRAGCHDGGYGWQKWQKTPETGRLRGSEATYNRYLVQRWIDFSGAATFCPQCLLLMMPCGGGFLHLTPWGVQTSQDASFSAFLWPLRQSFTHHDYSMEKSRKRREKGQGEEWKGREERRRREREKVKKEVK